MAWLVGDSFDFYTNINDANGVWDTAQSGGISTTTRFGVGQSLVAINSVSGDYCIKTIGTNEVTHHLCVAFQQSVALSGSTSGFYLRLCDGGLIQMSIIFRSDGAIVFTQGAGGTVTAIYSNAFAYNIWAQFEFEIVINGTTGSVAVRKNGNTVNDFFLSGINTRGGSTNNYANKLVVGWAAGNAVPLNVINAQRLDDLLWFSTSGAAPNTWVGDIRAVQLMPASDAVKTMQTFPAAIAMSNPSVTSAGDAATVIRYTPFVATVSGTITSVVVRLVGSPSGNLKLALFDNTGLSGGVAAPGNLISSPAAITGLGLLNTITLPTPINIINGQTVWIGVAHDAALNVGINNSPNGYTANSTYAAFPATNPGSLISGGVNMNLTLNTSPSNANNVAETTQDGDTSYVYSSNPGDADLYNLADLPSTPASIIGVVSKAAVRKSDAGTRTAQFQLKSGATTSLTTPAVLGSSYGYLSRVDTVDPNTGAAWTAAAVNALQIGPVVAS